MLIKLYYGPDRESVPVMYDHPFGRLMPGEVEAWIDTILKSNERVVSIALVEELPMTYLRALIRRKTIPDLELEIYHLSFGRHRQIRIGYYGELLDPWPTGSFDKTLDYILLDD